MNKMDCLFCKIVKGEIPAHVVYESDAALGILDVNPKAPGHAMVIPKIHAENVLDLPAESVGPVFLAVKETTEKLKKAFSPDGFTIGINHGRVSGQSVNHLHIHIMPRWFSDGGGSVHGVVSNPPRETLEEIKDRILRSNKEK